MIQDLKLDIVERQKSGIKGNTPKNVWEKCVVLSKQSNKHDKVQGTTLRTYCATFKKCKMSDEHDKEYQI